METTKETKRQLTVEDIHAHVGLSVALARVVATCLDECVDDGDELVNNMTCEFLTLYHTKGMPLVDERGEELGDNIKLVFEEALEERAGNPPTREYVRQYLIEGIIKMFE